MLYLHISLFIQVIARLSMMAGGFEFPLRDPLGNSFISAPLGSFLPPELDHNLKMNNFERSYEEV